MFDRFASLAAAFNLSARQSNVLRALVETGGIREAAAQLAMPYTATRNAVAELKTKLGVATVPTMIGMALELAPNELAPSGARLLRHDVFSLNDRQYAIARALGVATSRREIAKMLHISEAVLDRELKEIYLVLGVRSAGELTGVVSAAVTGQCDDAATALGDSEHYLPTATIKPGPRVIGFSDYGRTGGKPVLILHSTITSRAPPTRLVRALQSSGFRPIAIDRPGFGDTDLDGTELDPYLQAAHDVAAVCTSLNIESIDVVARGSGQAAVRLAQLYPDLIQRMVLVNPTPSIAFSTVDRGPLGAVKRAFAKRPWAVDAMIRLLVSYATPRRIYDGMLRSFRDSQPDSELVRHDPQFATDYLRAIRSFAHGRIAGYVAEQTAWAGGYDVAAIAHMTNWRILQGRHFVLHDPKQALEYWRAKLPHTPVVWEDSAGQMLAYSHPDSVISALVD